MTTMRRLRVTWAGIGGLPGLSTFYYGVASPNVSDCVAFFTAIKGLFPAGVTWDIPSSGDELDDVTGELTGVWAGTGGGTVTSSGAATSYAAGVGARVQWNTLVISSGSRVRGATFLAPLLGTGYDSSGTLEGTGLATMRTAATNFAASGVAKGIWRRPKPAPGGIGPDRPGLYAAINSATVPDRVTSLRSRRT
jgi:hypothetical protein